MAPNKPLKVVFIAVILLCIALGLGISRAAISIPMIEDPTAISITTGIVVPFIVFQAFLIYMIYRGKIGQESLV